MGLGAWIGAGIAIVILIAILAHLIYDFIQTVVK